VSFSALSEALRGLKLDQAEEIVGQLPADVMEQALELTAGKLFIPTPGPQTAAYFNQADVLLFGGSPGVERRRWR